MGGPPAAASESRGSQRGTQRDNWSRQRKMDGAGKFQEEKWATQKACLVASLPELLYPKIPIILHPEQGSKPSNGGILDGEQDGKTEGGAYCPERGQRERRMCSLKNILLGSSLVARWVKDPELSLLWLRFHPWPGNFLMPWAQPKQKAKSKGKKCFRIYFTLLKIIIIINCFCQVNCHKQGSTRSH